MATATLQTLCTWTQTDGLQPNTQTPVDTPTFTDSTPTQSIQQELLLPAAGTSVTLPIPSYWTTITQIQIVNVDTTGYVTLALNATSGAPSISLGPNGGCFACSFYATTVSGGIAPTPTTWTLKTMSSAGVTASGSATKVLFFCAGI